MSLSVNSNGKSSKGPKKNGFFSKMKRVFTPSSSSVSIASRTKSRDDDRESLGTTATRTRSRMSMFGGYRENKEALEAERQLEERKSKCLAIKAAKRDPEAVQRLLVDCEFCNPPPKFGRNITVESPGFDSGDTENTLRQMESLMESNANIQCERDWNPGLDEWLRMREWWLTPTAEEQPIHHLDSDLTKDRYYTVYDKMIYQTRPLKHPLNLSDVIKIVKAGWVGEGSWPQLDDNDVWSTTDAEDVKAAKQEAAETEAGKTSNGKTNDNKNNKNATSMALKPTFSSHSNTTSPQQSTLPSTELSPQSSLQNDIDGDELSTKFHDAPRIHVQFSDSPHPRSTGSQLGSMPKLERVQSSSGVPLRPVRSAQSSVVSITDSD